jgi:2-hydroxy-3-keto-5-methylthiopentenyl-1-phosphate phosphatase
MPGTRAAELLASKKPEDQKLAKRLMEYCRKCEAAFYEYSKVQKLRQEFKDVV